MPERVPRVVLVLGTSTGGVGRHVRSLAGGCVVACPAATQAVFGFPHFSPLEIGSRPHPLHDASAVRRLRVLARSADVVHAHGLRAGSLAALAGVRPLVVSWHNAVDGRLGRTLEQLVARRAQITLAASPDLADRARACGGRDVRLIPVSAPALVPTGVDPRLGRPLVLAVGRLHPQKGYDTLLAARHGFGDAVVAVAGEGPLAAELAVQAPDVHWLGRRDDVADLLAAAAVVVLPSRWEARSLTAQEAMRAGRPLVVTAVGGLPDLVRDGALVVAPGDPAALAVAVRGLLDDPLAAAALGERARVVAATWPDEAATRQQVAAVWDELAR